jgi:hypothetical protein
MTRHGPTRFYRLTNLKGHVTDVFPIFLEARREIDYNREHPLQAISTVHNAKGTRVL